MRSSSNDNIRTEEVSNEQTLSLLSLPGELELVSKGPHIA